MRGLLAGLIALLLGSLAAPVGAEDAPADLATAVANAEERGRAMYLYDQAAWHATDSFLEVFDPQMADIMRGYVVLPRDDGLLDTVFYGEVEGKQVEVARFTVDGSEVTGGGMLPENARPELSPLARRMAQARVAATEEAVRQSYGFCARSPANTLVLPPDESGTIEVYLLTPQTSNETYPLGGHYRFEVGVDGKVLSSRQFRDTCFEILTPRMEGASDSTAVVVTMVPHDLDPQPTEVHVFASYYRPFALFVETTGNDRVWTIDRGRINQVGEPGAEQN